VTTKQDGNFATHVQSSASVAGVAGRRCRSQAAAAPMPVPNPGGVRMHTHRNCLPMCHRNCNVDSFAGPMQPRVADSTEPKNDRAGDAFRCEA
jgi:hypothetical protein